MKKIKEGDIFEINTPKGKAYLHYIYKDKVIGELIRVLPGLFNDKPVDINKLVALEEEQFMVFFPLAYAYKKKIVQLTGEYPSTSFTKPKFMRTEFFVKGEFLGWHIIDTDSWQRVLVKNLSEDQQKLSPWGIWNDTLLIEKLTDNWNLENWG